jgi:CDP-diglyceride synthetase
MNQANLRLRVLFAVVAIPIFWWIINSNLILVPTAFTSLYFSAKHHAFYPGHLVAIILITIGMQEYVKMLSISYPKNGFWLVYIWLFHQFASFFIPAVALTNKLDIYLLLILVAAESAIWGRATERWKRASLLFSGVLFLSIASFSILNFYHGSLQNVFPQKFALSIFSQMGIVTICIANFMCDTAAYFVGSFFGKHHFSSVSPNKTVEGSIGGFLAAVISCTICWYFFADTTHYPLALGVALGMLIGVFAQLGDLLVSLIKRYFSVKDASNILPGHGGILDRFDSIFFSAPIINLFCMLITKLAE